MSDLNKVARLTIRLTSDQEHKAETAAAIVSRQRGERVKASTLVRELAMPQIDAIIAEQGERKQDAA